MSYNNVMQGCCLLLIGKLGWEGHVLAMNAPACPYLLYKGSLGKLHSLISDVIALKLPCWP